MENNLGFASKLKQRTINVLFSQGLVVWRDVIRGPNRLSWTKPRSREYDARGNYAPLFFLEAKLKYIHSHKRHGTTKMLQMSHIAKLSA